MKLKLKDIDGFLVDIASKEFSDKIKIIQIFGSWCPNCIDETKFFLDWQKENVAKLNHIQFFAVAFESFEQEQMALKSLRKLKTKLDWNYPILLGDYKGTKSVTTLFPIEKIRAFPTTLFLNKNNQILKVHTGFSGQATGPFFESFKSEFNKYIDELLK